ncbi:membrane integrity-associated transporter subunit PqiC [Pseudoalteromonas sp. CO302Y]|uniref:PqiC family protein n=1 Tax=unclassified Pseudoalteromonas TaxID=194690 RepID=UPI001022F795|nr:membrane integrity-associated transporter subunit PqiC [Pseudoalteromonas sp. CO302Y]RZG06169.1 membrane integrity-associated transporter subunit PqiC [Pseudoalteromonas sp. CO133X]
MNYKLIAFVSSLFVLSACSQTSFSTMQYYQFSQPITAMKRLSDGTQAQLRVNTVQLRGSLNNRGIAMVLDNNRINAANYHLWNESPDLMLTASAHQTLYTKLENWMVIKGLPVITDIDQQTYYELEYELHHFNGDQNGNANIAGLWRLYYTTPESGRQLKAINYFNEITPLDEDGYEGLVMTLESTWLEINQEVGAELSKLTL